MKNLPIAVVQFVYTNMKTLKRSVRRHHKRRMIQRVKKSRTVRRISGNERAVVARKLADNATPCSCEYSCGNPRYSRWSSRIGRLTRQEVKSKLDFAEQVIELSDSCETNTVSPRMRYPYV